MLQSEEAYSFDTQPLRLGGEVWDQDFHPDEPDVRVFVNPPDAVLRFDSDVLVTEGRHGDAVLRHYAFADRWFKINVTTDLDGNPIEHGGDGFAFNCDVATPMVAEGATVYAVDLFLDVLVGGDCRSRRVVDEDEFAEAVAAGLISRQEARGARAGLADLLHIVDGGNLVSFLAGIQPFTPSAAPVALPMLRRPVPALLSAGSRPSW